VSRCVGPGGIRLLWDEETGWAYAYVGPPDAQSPAARSPHSGASTRHPRRSPPRPTPSCTPGGRLSKYTKRGGRRQTWCAPRLMRAVRAEQAKRPAAPRY
jgi:hypothetical protein